MLRPTQPTANTLFVIFLGYGWLFIQSGSGTAEILLDALADKFLFVIKHETNKVKSSTCLIVTTFGYRKNLIITFYRESQFFTQIPVYLGENIVQVLFVAMQKYHIIRISEVILNAQFLFHPMVKVCKNQIGKVLRQIVPYRDTGCAVNDLVKQLQRVGTLDFVAYNSLQCFVVDAWIKLANVYFEAISGVLNIFQRIIYFLHTAVYAPAFNARKCILSKH